MNVERARRGQRWLELAAPALLLPLMANPHVIIPKPPHDWDRP
ncbi:MAG: hypothetical protein XU13_C0040G0023 [Candidatus Rokubacteria bacterium CSP1-6]|nr:MAG: hypothetical protein XU13_C0040G0023 [Candidatus Rokubacteria bacterium CSP1-6]